jgi:hypothetical protein|tara:strand:- start:179 stop:313 length:135 start_codon:yes stop_codon:yes gene_type:complete
VPSFLLTRFLNKKVRNAVGQQLRYTITIRQTDKLKQSSLLEMAF